MQQATVDRRADLTGAALITYSALGFGLIPIFALYAYAGGINVPTLLLIRFALAAPLLFAAVALRRRPFRLPRGAPAGLLLLSICYTLQSGTYFAAVRYIPLSIATLILYSYPAFVCLLARLVERARIPPATIAALLLSLAGVALVLGSSLAGLNLTGVLLALAAALVYSVYITASNRLLRAVEPLPVSAFVSLLCAPAFALFALATGTLDFRFSGRAWLWIAALIAVSTVSAILAFFGGLKRIGSTRAALLSMAEPLFTIGVSVPLFGEHLSLRQVLGGVLILGGAAWVTLARTGPVGVGPADSRSASESPPGAKRALGSRPGKGYH